MCVSVPLHQHTDRDAHFHHNYQQQHSSTPHLHACVLISLWLVCWPRMFKRSLYEPYILQDAQTLRLVSGQTLLPTTTVLHLPNTVPQHQQEYRNEGAALGGGGQQGQSCTCKITAAAQTLVSVSCGIGRTIPWHFCHRFCQSRQQRIVFRPRSRAHRHSQPERWLGIICSAVRCSVVLLLILPVWFSRAAGFAAVRVVLQLFLALM